MSAAAKIEQYLPYVAGVTAALVAGFVPPLSPYLVDGAAVERSSLYSAMFDFLAVTDPPPLKWSALM